MNERRACKLCTGREKTSREHVIPQWVSRCLPGEDRGFQVEQGADGRVPRRWSSRDVAQVRVHICRRCHAAFNTQSEDWASVALEPVISRGDISVSGS